jgi:hypothetical protein
LQTIGDQIIVSHMNTTTNTSEALPPRIAALVASVTLAGADRPGVILGSPATLSALCAFLGFRNPCSKGRVYLTGAKLRRLGIGL